MFIARDAPKVWHSVIVCRENILLPFPLCSLSVLCVSGVKLLAETLAIETQRTLRLHRERLEPFFPDRLVTSAMWLQTTSPPLESGTPSGVLEKLSLVGYKHGTPPG